jgi:hypothetical protein
MNKSYANPDTILESANSIPRPIYIPNAVAGYIGDMIIKIAKHKVNCADKKASG